MQSYSCKCGTLQSYGSMVPPPCVGCPKCGVVPATSPAHFVAPVPHQWQNKYDEDTGLLFERCLVCGFKRRKRDDVDDNDNSS